MNINKWRKRRNRYTRPVHKTAQKQPENLLERLLRYARMKGLHFYEKQHKVDFLMVNGALLTIYRGTKPTRYFGEIYYPNRKFWRFLLLDEDKAEFLYNTVGKAINELKEQRHGTTSS